VTFADAAPVLKKHCWDCHRSGGSAPFSLTGYKEASRRAESVAEVVADGRMPPWFASHEFGPFVNRRGLSHTARGAIPDSLRPRAPPGDAPKPPPPPNPPTDKRKTPPPDPVLQSGVFDLPAKGIIPYKYAVLLHVFPEDTWVQHIQIVPDNPAVLHHGNMAY